jgi:hypothetical protein
MGCAQGHSLAESENVGPRSALRTCSQRLPLVRNVKIDPSVTSLQALKFAFDAKRTIGIDENVQLRPTVDGKSALIRVHYPKGSTSFSATKQGRPLGGASFYSPFSQSKVLCLHYRVRFPHDFRFVRGGKLPGLYGGSAPSGGKAVTGMDGWSVRLMWRMGGEGELYEYIANMDEKFGLSVGRGVFTFPRGQWIDIDLEVVINEPSRADGVARLWIDGRAVIEQNDIVFAAQETPFQAGLMFSTFFGGSDETWATPKDQYIDFGDFRMYAGNSR